LTSSFSRPWTTASVVAELELEVGIVAAVVCVGGLVVGRRLTIWMGPS
jgi:L-aminopeptidase/D-esterase-like protein